MRQPISWIVMGMLMATGVHAQAPAPAPTPGAAAAAALPRYPLRPPADPALVEKGHGIYSVNCSFCHGGNAKGGETGPSLVRSEIVLNDKAGELIGEVTARGVLEKGMPKFEFSADELKAIAAFIHSFPVGEAARAGTTLNSVVGNAKAGAAYFNGAGKCTQCHSATGDLAKVGAKYTPKNLQTAMLMGGIRTPTGLQAFTASAVLIAPGTTVTVTPASGPALSGKLDRIDEFTVSLTDASGISRTIRREGAEPRVEIKDPVRVHTDMLRRYKDVEIQNLTAYLVTLK